MNRLYLFILALALIFLIASPFAAKAEDVKAPVFQLQNNYKYRESEKIGFAFYKLSKLTPKFEEWIKGMPSYHKGTKDQKEAMLIREQNRLSSGFNGYDPAVDMIKMMIPVRLQFPNKIQRDSDFAEGKKVKITIEVRDFDEGFFPFLVGYYWIALYPDELHKAMSFELDQNDFVFFQQHLSMDPQASQWSARAELQFIPYATNSEEPLIKKGKPIWMMSAKIASVEVFKLATDDPVWMAYKADWYATERETDLLELFQE